MARYDADYFTKDCFAEKFEFLLDMRYRKLDKHKRRGQFENDYNKYYQDDIHSSISQWFSRRQRPSIEKLMNICELLDCDIDYFLTNQKNFKKSTAHASETTGLKYETIEKIEILKNTNIEIETLDKLLNHKNFERLILLTWDYTHSHNKEITITNTLDNSSDSPLINDAQREMMKYRAVDVFGKILDNIYDAHTQEAIDAKIGSILAKLKNEIEPFIEHKDIEKIKQRLLYIVSHWQNEIKELRPDFLFCKFTPEQIIDNFDLIKDTL